MAPSRLFPTAKSGKNRNRSLRVENLEGRELLAADAGISIIDPNIDFPIPDISDIVIPIDPWVGTWDNNDPAGGLTKLQISKGGDGGYDVQAWGNCIPTDCDWGKTDLNVLGTSVGDPTATDYAVGTWEHGFKDATITVDRLGSGFVVDIHNLFRDDSGRSNYRMRYLLSSDGNMTEMLTINNDGLADVLVGGWVNVDENTGGITALKYSTSFGVPSVEAFGACHPTDCVWGSTSVDLVGTSIGDMSPQNTVSSWDFDHADTTITSRLVGSRLVVDSYTVFTDGSDRTNFHSQHQFMKVGDSNHDGLFNSSDLVTAFGAGEFEDGIVGNSTWEEGDWNRDGDFDTSDLVYAFQCGGFEAPPVPMHPPKIVFPGPIGPLSPVINLGDLGDLTIPEIQPIDPIGPVVDLGIVQPIPDTDAPRGGVVEAIDHAFADDFEPLLDEIAIIA
jgi:hypothetical protein